MNLVLRELRPGDDVARFSLGDKIFVPLKIFLRKHAQQYHSQNICKTYVLVEKGEIRVFGYVSLVCSQIELVGKDLIPGFPYEGAPCLKIVRLAIDKSLQGKGLGIGLVNWCISVASQRIMPHVGCRFLVVDSKPESIDFYKDRGFTLLDTQKNKDSKCPLLFMDLNKIV